MVVPEAVDRRIEYSLVGHHRLRGDYLQRPTSEDSGKSVSHSRVIAVSVVADMGPRPGSKSRDADPIEPIEVGSVETSLIDDRRLFCLISEANVEFIFLPAVSPCRFLPRFVVFSLPSLPPDLESGSQSFLSGPSSSSAFLEERPFARQRSPPGVSSWSVKEVS